MSKGFVCEQCGEASGGSPVRELYFRFGTKATKKPRNVDCHLEMTNIRKPDLCEKCFRNMAIVLSNEGTIKYTDAYSNYLIKRS